MHTHCALYLILKYNDSRIKLCSNNAYLNQYLFGNTIIIKLDNYYLLNLLIDFY